MKFDFKIRRAKDRGITKLPWLKSYHSFSFGDYYDANFMGFESLRVINDDVVAASNGFPLHPHSNMEIITFVLQGELAHKDSLGHSSTIPAGCFQAMSAGSGIRHSEFNPSSENPVHLLQIWIQPNSKNVVASYSEFTPTLEQLSDKPLLIAGNHNSSAPIKIYQNVCLFYQKLAVGNSSLHLPQIAYLHLASGRLKLDVGTNSNGTNSVELQAGDAIYWQDCPLNSIAQIESLAESKFLLFDFEQ